MIGLPTQALAFLAVFVYATHATQAIAFEWKPGLRRTRAGVKEDVRRGRVKGKVANPGSPGKTVVRPACVEHWYTVATPALGLHCGTCSLG